MGVFTLNASNIKGFTRKFVCYRPGVRMSLNIPYIPFWAQGKENNSMWIDSRLGASYLGAPTYICNL